MARFFNQKFFEWKTENFFEGKIEKFFEEKIPDNTVFFVRLRDFKCAGNSEILS